MIPTSSLTAFIAPGGRVFYPYDYAYISITAEFDGEERTGFCFAPARNSVGVALDLEKHGARCIIGYSCSIEYDEEHGFPNFRSWVHAVDNSEAARKIGTNIVVIYAR